MALAAEPLRARQDLCDYPATSRVAWSRKTAAGVIIDAEEALKVACVWACVRFISQGVGQLPWRIMQPASKGKGFEAADPSSGLAFLLARRPNP